MKRKKKERENAKKRGRRRRHGHKMGKGRKKRKKKKLVGVSGSLTFNGIKTNWLINLLMEIWPNCTR